MFSLSRLALRRSLPVLQRLAVTRTFVTRPIAVNFCTKPHSDILGQLDKKIQMQYTCKVCNTRNSQTMSNVAYTKGVVIVTCSGCKNNHLVADNLGWFRNEKVNIEDLLREKGETVRRVSLGNEFIVNENAKE